METMWGVPHPSILSIRPEIKVEHKETERVWLSLLNQFW